MELKGFMGSIIDQLTELRDENPNKRKYLIDELEFELYISEVTNLDGRVNVRIINIGAGTQNQVYHKVKVKLKPKNNNSDRSIHN